MTESRPETVVYVATSLDGFIARTDGGIDWLPTPPEGEDYGWSTFMADVDAMVMGRKTFELVLSFGVWPYEGTPVYVWSSTLEEIPAALAGKAELVQGTPSGILTLVAGEGRRRVYVDGGRVIQSFLREGLMDELIITKIPVLIGSGIPLFGDLDGDQSWTHVETGVLDEGFVRSRYRRA